MKSNAKCKKSPFEPPHVDLGVTHRVRLWLVGKHIVDFLLAIIQLLSLALMAAALLSEICLNRRFLKGWVTLSAFFDRWGLRPHRWAGKKCFSYAYICRNYMKHSLLMKNIKCIQSYYYLHKY